MHALSVIAGALLLLLFSSPAGAWGPDGHRIVCHIAWHEMSKKARDSIKAALDVRSEFEFAETCNWADAVRGTSDFGYADNWHFVNVPVTARSVNIVRDCKPAAGAGCAVTAIAVQVETLRHSAGDEARQNSLRFLMHFVGDLHQPLHVSFKKDRGGGRIEGKFLGKQTNMHSVWDGGLLHEERDPRGSKRRMAIVGAR
jgi:hypothetical protein